MSVTFKKDYPPITDEQRKELMRFYNASKMQSVLDVLKLFTTQDLQTPSGYARIDQHVRQVLQGQSVFCQHTGKPLDFYAVGQTYDGKLMPIFRPVPEGDRRYSLSFNIGAYDNMR